MHPRYQINRGSLSVPDVAEAPQVVAVSKDGAHNFSKSNCAAIRLLAGLGVEGDAHLGKTVKHRSRVRIDPTQPNLRPNSANATRRKRSSRNRSNRSRLRPCTSVARRCAFTPRWSKRPSGLTSVRRKSKSCEDSRKSCPSATRGSGRRT